MKNLIIENNELGLDLFFPIISLFVPWSGETLINGRPRVMFIALKLKIVFIGVNTWSWYMPITTSNLSILFLEKKVSAEKGPVILILFFNKFFIAGLIMLSSSLYCLIVSQWGFKPKIAKKGFFLRVFLKKWSIFNTLLIIFSEFNFYEKFNNWK